jgi:glycosyltransferase involved in cell wall biosynthesis
MKRIAIVLPSMACAGAEVLMAAHAMALADLGHKVALVCFQKHYPSWANFPDKEKLLSTIEFVELDCSVKFRFLRKAIFYNQAWIDFMDAFKPDIVHSNLYLSELLVYSYLKKGVKYVSHGHDNMPQLRRFGIKTLFNKTLLTNWWERRWLMKQYKISKTHFIAISKDVEDYVKENCPSLRGSITRVPNAIDRKRFWVQRDYTKPKPIFKLLSVGSLVPKKNHEYLIGLARILKSKGYAFEVNVLGDGPLKSELIHKTEQADCADCLFFRGSVPDVPRWMAESDLYVHPATYEPFGLVLIEAMTSGMPVISLDGRGNRGLVENGVTGYFLPVDAPQEEFVKWVEKCMLDREKLIKMGLAAQEFSEEFDIEGYSKRLLHVYIV